MARAQNDCARLSNLDPVVPGVDRPAAKAGKGNARGRLAGLLAAGFMAAALVALPGCPSSGSTPPPLNVAVGYQAEYVDANAAFPSAFAASADGRVFFTEKNTGQIRVIQDGVVVAEPVASVPVNFADDRGLLGIALSPNFNTNGQIYVFYTRSDTGESTADPRAVVDNRVVYFTVPSGSNVATGGETFVVSLPAGDTTRVGGVIGFAQDLTLLVGFGDTTNQGAAQDPNQLFGKILRYNGDGTIPDDNPTAGSPVFALGFCDPRGLTFDPQSAVPFVNDRRVSGTDVFQIDRVLPGKNYGWPEVVGVADTPAERAFVAQTPNYEDPIVVSTGDGFAGLAFNPSTKYGATARLQPFYGLIESGKMFRLELFSDRTATDTPVMFGQHFPTPVVTVSFTPAGTLFVASPSAILRVVAYQATQ